MALCSLIILGTATVQAADPEVAAVQATVYNYFEGINTKDRARLESAFDTSAQLKSPDGAGAVKVEPIADAIARWMDGKAQSRKGKILAFEITDNQVAQVVFDYDGIFVDFLTLFKLDGQWPVEDRRQVVYSAIMPLSPVRFLNRLERNSTHGDEQNRQVGTFPTIDQHKRRQYLTAPPTYIRHHTDSAWR